MMGKNSIATPDDYLRNIHDPELSESLVSIIKKVNSLDHKYHVAMRLIQDKIAPEFIDRNPKELNLKEKAIVLHLQEFAILATDPETGVIRPWKEVMERQIKKMEEINGNSQPAT